MAVDADGAVEHLDRARERAVDRVVAQQVREHLEVHGVVDADPFEVGALLVGGAEHRAPGAAEAVDAEFRVHACTVERAGASRHPLGPLVRVSSLPGSDGHAHRAPRRLDRARARGDGRGRAAPARLPRLAVGSIALVPLLQRRGGPRRRRPPRRGPGRRALPARAARGRGHGGRARDLHPRGPRTGGGRLRGGRRLARPRDRDGAARPPGGGRRRRGDRDVHRDRAVGEPPDARRVPRLRLPGRRAAGRGRDRDRAADLAVARGAAALRGAPAHGRRRGGGPRPAPVLRRRDRGRRGQLRGRRAPRRGRRGARLRRGRRRARGDRRRARRGPGRRARPAPPRACARSSC